MFYHAMVCHSRYDISFVKVLITELEDKHHLKLCVPERDFVAGGSIFEALAKAIKKYEKIIIELVTLDVMMTMTMSMTLLTAETTVIRLRRNVTTQKIQLLKFTKLLLRCDKSSLHYILYRHHYITSFTGIITLHPLQASYLYRHHTFTGIIPLQAS